MPTYDYHCTTCGHRFEYFQSITSEPLHHCPRSECIQEDEEKKGTGEVIRMVSAGAGLLFKGEGFYLTDYARKGSSGKESGSSGSTPAKSESKGSGSTGGSTSGGAGSSSE
jgi:putative FmdB family regulatory protein